VDPPSGAMPMRGGRISRFDCVVCELLLGTDAVDMVVKATVARAGQVAIATENSIVEPAPPTAETSAGSSFLRSSGKAAIQCQKMVRLPPKLSVKADISAQRPSAIPDLCSAASKCVISPSARA
jgi:hypothetical protein